MVAFHNINDVLDFAIGEEQGAVDFYLQMAEQTSNGEIRKVFQEFAEEEMRHKKRLMEVKETGISTFQADTVPDLKVSDYLVDIKPKKEMSYEEALILAMKKEKAAFRLYSALAERTNDPAIADLFRLLALEESRHKLRFEVEYDDYILREN